MVWLPIDTENVPPTVGVPLRAIEPFAPPAKAQLDGVQVAVTPEGKPVTDKVTVVIAKGTGGKAPSKGMMAAAAGNAAVSTPVKAVPLTELEAGTATVIVWL